MRYLHTMVRVRDLERSLHFYCDLLGLKEIRRKDFAEGRFSLIFLEMGEFELELTYNWEQEEAYSIGRNFGHLAFEVDNIYQKCEQLQKEGVIILRPPREGRMAFIKSPDGISIELLQKGKPLLPQEPWNSMENIGSW